MKRLTADVLEHLGQEAARLCFGFPASGQAFPLPTPVVTSIKDGVDVRWNFECRTYVALVSSDREWLSCDAGRSLENGGLRYRSEISHRFEVSLLRVMSGFRVGVRYAESLKGSNEG